MTLSKYFFLLLSEGSTWTSGPARPTRPFWHPWVRRHWCEYTHQFAQQVFHKDHHCAREIPTQHSFAVLQSYPQRALQMKTHRHKRALFPTERGVFEKGPSAQSKEWVWVCVTVMRYIWDILGGQLEADFINMLWMEGGCWVGGAGNELPITGFDFCCMIQN